MRTISEMKNVLFTLLLGMLLMPLLSAKRPNIVVIMADDIAFDNNFGAYGAAESWTPRMDQMAQEGMTFEYAHSTPKCTPSRVKIMTGRSGVRNYIGFGKLPITEVNFAQMLKGAGYKTHVAGKWQLDSKGGTPCDESGFDTYFLWNTQMGRDSRYWEPSFNINGEYKTFGKDDFGPDLCVESIDEFVGKNKDESFFVYYPMLLVHGPFVTTPDSEVRERKDSQRNFEDMIKYMDKCVGRVLDSLKKHGVDENTVVMFCTDNGTNRALDYESFGKVLEGKKGVPHDRGTHSPLIVRAPGHIKPGIRCNDLIDFADVMPTLAEIGEAKLPDVEIDGISFWPQCLGQKGNPKGFIFNYYWPKGYDWIPEDLGKGELRWVQTHEYKLFANEAFYDLKNDYEQLSPLPIDALNAEQQKAYDFLKKSLDAMPQTNPHYYDKEAKKSAK